MNADGRGNAKRGEPRVTILVSQNDLEGRFIWELARKPERCASVIDLGLDWGKVPDLNSPQLDPRDMADHVVLIELPLVGLEKKLAHAGKLVSVIDHHAITLDDGSLLDRQKDISSVDQLISLLGWQLDAAEEKRRAAVSANDVGSWFALMRLFGDKDAVEATRLAQEIRDEEEKIRSPFEGDIENPAGKEWRYFESNSILRADKIGEVAGKGPAGSYFAREFTTGLDNPEHRSFHLLCGPHRHIRFAGEAYIRHLAIAAHRRARKRGDEKADTEAPPILRIGLGKGNEPGPVASLFFSGGNGAMAIIRELLAERRKVNDPMLKLVAGGNQEGGYLYALGNSVKLSRLADRIIDNATGGARPIRRWQTSFIQPLEVDGGAIRICSSSLQEPARDPERDFGVTELSEAARSYFLPALQRTIVPSIQQAADALADGEETLPLISWNIPLKNSFSLRIRYPGDDGKARDEPIIEEPVKRLIVHLGFGNLIYLEWQFGNAKELRPERDEYGGEPLWLFLLCKALLPGQDGKRISTVGQVLDLNYAARMCFSSSKRARGERRLVALVEQLPNNGTRESETRFGFAMDPEPERPRGWFGALVDHALKHFPRSGGAGTSLSSADVRLILDERARFVAALVPEGGPPDLPSGKAAWEVVRARLAGGDEFRETHFYDTAFALRELRQGSYDRFRPTTRYQASSHSFTMLGWGSYAAGDGCEHMREHYARLFLVAQGHAATFQSMWQHLIRDSTRAGVKLEQRADEANRQREKMVRYANAFWFLSLTHQIQGQELYSLMLRQLPVDREHDELDRQIKDNEQVAVARRSQLADSQRAGLAIAFGIVAIFVAVEQVANDLFVIDTNVFNPWLAIALFLLIAGLVTLCVGRVLTILRR